MSSLTVDIAMEGGAGGVVLHHRQGGVPQPGGVAWPGVRTAGSQVPGHLWSGPESRPCAGRTGPGGGWQGSSQTSPWPPPDPGIRRAHGRGQQQALFTSLAIWLAASRCIFSWAVRGKSLALAVNSLSFLLERSDGSGVLVTMHCGVRKGQPELILNLYL